ncbi:Uncharacterized protein Fot_03386 [Forsythia ovata]|uniref:Uncharacterized protein n=1 Tax=Forsythia ovata TaxID=205694 RepID=A0ABD1XA27_9LAMI
MTSTRSKSKSRQKCKRRRQNSASKRNRGQTKAVLKPERKKFNIHVPEGENISNLDADPGMESMHLSSSKGKHITASFDQNVGEAFDNQDNPSKIDDHTVTNVQSSSKTSKASGHVPEMLMKLAESGSKTEVFEVEVQPLDEGYRKKQKISCRIKDCNDEPDKQTRSETSLYLLDDDIIFSEEDLRHMDESAEKNCVQSQKVSSQFAEYIFEGKIEEMLKRFDTKAARHNMAVQLYKYANEKPESQLDL